MKKYTTPSISVECFDVCDVLMLSTVTTTAVQSNIASQLDDGITFKSSTVSSAPIVDSGAIFYLN